jgi:putative xylitol transport system ATP-binding protein
VDGTLDVRRGEIHALCGRNGAGKSTLLKILMGFLQPDAGEIRIDGSPVRFRNAREALDAGIAIVQQELSAVPDLTVAENIFLGAEPRRYGFVDFARLNRDAEELLKLVGCDARPTETMKRLPIAAQQLVEIAKALSHRNADILILDEPTSAIGEKDAGRLFQTMRNLAASGKGIVFVSHRIAEVFEIADRYTVLKDGRRVASGSVAETTPAGLIEAMVGGPVEREFAIRSATARVPLLEVNNLTRAPHFHGVGFTLHAGEVLGIYGRVGSGRTETLEAIYGLRPMDAGGVSIGGRALRDYGPAEALQAGIAYATEDRKRNGLILCASVGDNLLLSVLQRTQRWGFVDARRWNMRVNSAVERMRIQPPDAGRAVRSLSGGNQQKVVLGRCILTEPSVLLLDEPTRGVDVAGKKEIYRFMEEFTGSGGGVVIVSSELEEILAVSHRVVVFRKGRVAATFDRQHATERDLVAAAD